MQGSQGICFGKNIDMNEEWVDPSDISTENKILNPWNRHSFLHILDPNSNVDCCLTAFGDRVVCPEKNMRRAWWGPTKSFADEISSFDGNTLWWNSTWTRVLVTSPAYRMHHCRIGGGLGSWEAKESAGTVHPGAKLPRRKPYIHAVVGRGGSEIF